VYTSELVLTNSFDLFFIPWSTAEFSSMFHSADLRTSSVISIEQKCGPHIEHPPPARLCRNVELREEKSWGQR
jgi:hypothetical protein